MAVRRLMARIRTVLIPSHEFLKPFKISQSKMNMKKPVTILKELTRILPSFAKHVMRLGRSDVTAVPRSICLI